MSILSGITSIASGGMSTVYKYLAIGGVALALAVSGYFYGTHIQGKADKAAMDAYVAKRDQQDVNLLGINLQTQQKIVTQVVTKEVHIHDVQTEIHTVIPDVVDKYMLSSGWVRVHNAGATSSEIDAASAADATPSGVTAVAALATVTDNYATCNNYKVVAEGLQQFINDYNTAVDQVNKQAKKK